MRRPLATLVIWLVVAPTALACPKTSLGDLEDEVMCPACGTSLAIAPEDQPLAARERVFIQGLIDDCRSKDEIKTALVDEFGDEVLALPDADDGFEIAAYLIPAVILLGAGAAIAVGVQRWRRSPPGTPGPGATSGESKRLDEDLARYDL